MGKSRFRWHHDLLLIGQTIVGTVSQGASGDWFAYGCMDDWEDTPLGASANKETAKDEVLAWAEDHL